MRLQENSSKNYIQKNRQTAVTVIGTTIGNTENAYADRSYYLKIIFFPTMDGFAKSPVTRMAALLGWLRDHQLCLDGYVITSFAWMVT